MNSLERFLAAAHGRPVDSPPIWIMRQAGRTLPEYRELREKHSFWDCCLSPELASEVTLQPVRRFGFDAAVIFSDILVVPAAMGMKVGFSPLALAPVIRTADDVRALRAPDATADLGYVGRAIATTVAALENKTAVLGFSGAPYTLATYMVEGKSDRDFQAIKSLMFGSPAVFGELMKRLADAVSDYLLMQVESGASAVQLFDTWAGMLSPDDFERYALPHVRAVVERVGERAPVIYYVNGIGGLLPRLRGLGAQVFGIDWRTDLAQAREILGKDQPVQGNLDPAALFAPAEEIRSRVFEMLDKTGGRGHIVNLGHGVWPETPLSGIEAFIAAVSEWAEGGR